jgi:transposase
MFGLSVNHRFSLYSKPCDMRKSFNGLCGLVQNDLEASPSNGIVYIFINKSRNKIKLLHWRSGGFLLYYKRLESGTFDLPNYDEHVQSMSLSYTQLVLLIDGIAITHLDRKKRYELVAKTG